MLQNKFYKTEENLTADEVTAGLISEDERRNVDSETMNLLVLYNASDGLIFCQLNADANERYPVPPNGGRLVITKEDNIPFSQIQLVEPNSTNLSGKIHITYGRV